MEGLVTAYSGTSLTINADMIGAGGTAADWNLNVAGQQGQQGVAGPVGPTGPSGTAAVSADALNLARLGSDSLVYVPDATHDGSIYGRINGAYSKALPLGGGTLTGALILAGDPASALQPVTLQYFNGNIPGGASALPIMNGAAAVGTAVTWARADHVHPSDTSRLSTSGAQTITGGFQITPYNIGAIASPMTPNPLVGNYQYGTNNSAITINVPAVDCAMDILVTNGASAGAITFSGFSVGASVGDALTTTNGNKFIVSIRRINAISTYVIKALQ
jgi:hypothetical protein